MPSTLLALGCRQARLAAIASLALLGGCAHVWVDTDGNRHVVGLLHLTLPPRAAPPAAETLRVRTLGLSWTQADAGNALVVGYADTTLGFLRNDVCVALDRLDPQESRRK